MYNHVLIEKKWRKYWEENAINKFVNDDSKPKYYVLDMFPYPSGSALHIGHGRTYALSDFYARYKLACGYNVLHPIGWDAFGLPSEQYAIKNNRNPQEFNQNNINFFREQLKLLGFYYDYDYEVDTTDPKFYKTTQWIFEKFYEQGLAKLEEVEVNWCEELKTVLANDEIVIKDGAMFSERGNYPVIKKMMKQWILKITDYAEILDEGLDMVDWDDSFKLPQKKWIGISHGALITFKTTNDKEITVFTTRPDTIFGVSYIAIAPENKDLLSLCSDEQKDSVKQYIKTTETKTELERKEQKSKTGVFTGVYAINPFNNKEIPIYTADYVLNNYATGSIMGVPAHDKRDYDFAIENNLPIIQVIESKEDTVLPISKEGTYINSHFLNGLTSKKEAINKILELIEEKNIGKATTTTKLHDWTFSRQRYWGEPFPVLYDEHNKIHLVPKDQLPVVLPELENYSVDQSGKSPLSRNKDWLNVEMDGKHYTRETQTMPGSAGSSWYYLGYILKNPDGSYIDIDSEEAKKRFKRWLSVDLYVGGTEHTTGHVLYARFFHKFLYKLGILDKPEPFNKLIDHGLILAPDGRKMGKRYGNTIMPNDLAQSHGVDAFRVYSAFIGPANGIYPWNPANMDGIRKWLDRVFNLFQKNNIEIVDDINVISKELNIAFNKFVKDATNNMEEYKHNLVISDMMVYINACYNVTKLYKKHVEGFLTILSCFAPFLSEELNETILHINTSITKSIWPKFDENLIHENVVNLPIQINGKLRHVISVKRDISKDEVIAIAINDEKIKSLINGKYNKIIYVPNKILNIIL